MPYLQVNQKIKVVNVSEFTRIVNNCVSEIELVWIEGEVSNFKNWQDHWIFFSLKDEYAVLNCNLPKYRLESFGFDIEDGMKIRVLGIPELRYKGDFSLNIEEIQICGEGALKKAYELLKKKT
jgi:exodeoxyribonuclease VII large subunit